MALPNIQRLTLSGILGILQRTPEQCLFDWKRDLIADTDEKRSEVVKDIVAIANGAADGPGFVFYGVNPKHPDRVVGMSSSHDELDSRLQQLVKGKIEPVPEFLFYTLTHDEKTVGVMHVARSRNRPHIVSKDFGKLREGQILIRRGSSTGGITQDELREMFGVPEGLAYLDEYASVVERERRLAREYISKHSLPDRTYFFWFAPASPILDHTLPDLLGCLRRVVEPRKANGLPMGMDEYANQKVKSIAGGARMQLTPIDDMFFEHWFLDPRGGFFLLRTYDELPMQYQRQMYKRQYVKHVILEQQRIRFIAEAVELCLAFYREAGLAPEAQMRIEITHGDLARMDLGRISGISPMWSVDDHPIASAIDDKATSVADATLQELEAGKADLVKRFVNEVLVKYDFRQIDDGLFEVEYSKFIGHWHPKVTQP